MHSGFPLTLLVALTAACTVAFPQTASAQAFTADYTLMNASQLDAQTASSAPGSRPSPVSRFDLGALRISPALHADPVYSGAGLSFEAGRNWFANVGVGRSLQSPSSGTPAEVLSISGGYRWADGQALSLQLSGARGGERLGLAVRYDWPRYFVRLSYDTRINLSPTTDILRLSAGVKF